jgi:predicted metal-dependent hydrolase
VVQPSRRSSSVQPTLPLAGPEGDQIEVRRSARRKRTVSAYREDGRVIVLIPASFSAAEERRWVAAMLERLRAQETRRKPAQHELGRRAAELSRRYLGGAARPVSVRWVDNQRGRWGSCTPLDGTIRISSRVRGMPGFVLDYVLLHELAHLLEPSHGPRFWALLEPYPKLERARGYLEGVAATAGLDISPDEPDPEASAEDGPVTEDGWGAHRDLAPAGDVGPEPDVLPEPDELWGADEVWRSDRPAW